jgi:hypothetical protein
LLDGFRALPGLQVHLAKTAVQAKVQRGRLGARRGEGEQERAVQVAHLARAPCCPQRVEALAPFLDRVLGERQRPVLDCQLDLLKVGGEVLAERQGHVRGRRLTDAGLQRLQDPLDPLAGLAVFGLPVPQRAGDLVLVQAEQQRDDRRAPLEGERDAAHGPGPPASARAC